MNEQTLTLVGYWHDEYGSEDFPDPRTLVDPSWEIADRDKIVSFLQAGARLRECMGTSYCRFPGGPPSSEMGNADLTDGTWVWPEGLWVYVKTYSVKLPPAFIDHMKARRFVVGSVDLSDAKRRKFDTSYWREWSFREARGERRTP